MFATISSFFKSNNQSSKPLNEWLKEYQSILELRRFKPKTIEIKNYLLNIIEKEIGTMKIGKVSTFEITNLIKIFVTQDKNPTAKCMYHLLKDIFREAYANGWINQNPTDPIKPPKTPVKRCRMTLREFKKILDKAEQSRCKYMYDAMLLALVTGQRRSDIVTLKKSDIKRNYLHIQQCKTGERIAIPLKLRCKKINISLNQLIENAGDCDFLVNDSGQPVSTRAITQNFSRIRDRVFSSKYWKSNTPFTFHEIRSLSERLYRDQKVDTKTLLGHKSQQTTDLYNDSRGRECRYLRL